MEKVQDHLYVLILAGGGGTRLWPESRESSPKQFLKLFENKSLFRLTLDRAKQITTPDRIFIITSHKHLPQIKKEAATLPSENIIGEPMRRDTALALGLGAAVIHEKDPRAVIINLPSDHLIKPNSVYTSEIKKAASVAFFKNEFVVVGVKPRFAHSGYGHIKTQGKVDKDGVLAGRKFIEKPPMPLAEKYARDPHYLWNIGQYIWPAQLFLELLKKHAPKTYAFLPKIKAALGSDEEKPLIRLAYQMAPTISVDYAVSEKLDKFLAFPASFFWTDIGDWHEVWNNLPKDRMGNVITARNGRGEYVGIDSQNNLLFLDKQLITTVGVQNMLIVDTRDAILICPKDDAQAVKKVVEMLKEQKLTKYL